MPVPRDVRAFDIGQEITHNTLPMRVQGFVSDAPPHKVMELFRQGMGAPLVESRVGSQRVLGRMQGEYYMSVQIEPAERGTRGTIAVTHLRAAPDGRDAALRQREEWTSRLAPGSRVLTETDSRDGAKTSRHVVYVNSEGEAANREQLRRILREEGLVAEPEGAPGGALFFKGRAADAMATFHTAPNGRTTVVLNVVTSNGAPP